jgi:hypothetical protein
MLIESLATFYNLKKKPEKFAEEKKTTPLVSTWYDILYIIFAGVWFVVLVLLWVRIVYMAFKCSVKEGFASILFSSHYGLYKFGDLIKVSCASVKP